MSTTPIQGLSRDQNLVSPSISPLDTNSPDQKPINVAASSSSNDQEKINKKADKSSLRTPPRMISLRRNISAQKNNAGPTPKSPRQLKEKKADKSKFEGAHINFSPSSQSSENSIKKNISSTFSSQEFHETRQDNNFSSTNIVIKVIKLRVPSALIKKMEKAHIDHVPINLLVDDLVSQSIPVDQRHAIGRNDSVFYISNLPETLKPFFTGSNQATISSSKLLQKIFSEDFRLNTGWATAKIFYANAMFNENLLKESVLGESDPSVKELERERLKGLAEVITKSIFGHPVNLENSPLPRRFIDALIYADQRFHDHLLKGKTTKSWSTEQIRDARFSVVKLFTVTRLLMPMMSDLAAKNPSQKEIWCLGLIMQTLLNSASLLSKEILIRSFSQSSSSLQAMAKEKENHERIQNRADALTANAKRSTRHVHSRSQDSQVVDIDWLARRGEVKKQRAMEKMNNDISRLEFDDDKYEKVIKEGNRAIQENEEIRKAESDIKEFSWEEIEQLEKILAERDIEQLMSELPEGDVEIEHTQPLPISTTDFSSGGFSNSSDEHQTPPEKEST